MSELDLLNDYADRRRPIRKVYERYKHLDYLLSDKERLIGDGSDTGGMVYKGMVFEMWRAIREAMEERP